MAERLMADEVENVVRSVLSAAAVGDMGAARLVLDRLVPVRRGAPISLALPAICSAEDVDEALSGIVAAMASGEVSPDEAATAAGVVELKRKSIETNELARRLADVEAKIGGSK